jgi:selenide,water dikinase
MSLHCYRLPLVTALLMYCWPDSLLYNMYCCTARYAVGTRGWLTFQGGWAWSLKDYIDRAFMDKYGSALPFDKVMAMQPPSQTSSSSGSSSNGLLGWLFRGSSSSSGQQQLPGAFAAAGSEGAELFAASAMRCGGCGAKVGSSTLSRVLKRIKAQQQQQQVSSAGVTAAAAVGGGGLLQQVQLGADDAALLPPPPPGHLLVSTVDFFRAFWPDAYLLGKIAANHALGVSLQGMVLVLHQ